MGAGLANLAPSVQGDNRAMKPEMAIGVAISQVGRGGLPTAHRVWCMVGDDHVGGKNILCTCLLHGQITVGALCLWRGFSKDDGKKD